MLLLATVSSLRRRGLRSTDLGGPLHGAWRILKAKRQIADTALLKNKFKNEIYTRELICIVSTEAIDALQD